MNNLDRTLFGIAIVAATTFGGIVYSNVLNRIAIVEAHADSSRIREQTTNITLAEINVNLKHVLDDVAAIKRGLNSVRILSPSTRTRYPEGP